MTSLVEPITVPGITETSSTESIVRLVQLHRQALRGASRKFLRDNDEFSVKLQKNAEPEAPIASDSSGSRISFVPNRIYTIDEATEDSALSVREGIKISEEMRERIDRLRQRSAAARSAKRPMSRRGSDSRPLSSEFSDRIRFHENIVQKFEMIDRFLKDQTVLKQDTSSADTTCSTARRYTRSRSTPEKNRVIRSLCCSCISGQN